MAAAIFSFSRLRMDSEQPKRPLHVSLLVDSACGVTAASLVAPFISIIDKSIFSNASGKEKMRMALYNGFQSLIRNPITFVKRPSFLLIWGVYSSTYIVANAIENICIFTDWSWYLPKFIGTS